MNHQEWERKWHGNCVNSFGEEYKQLAYAKRMGLKFYHNGKSPFNIDMQGKSVIDIGGGPVSLLLKCENVKGVVIDPCEYPDWIYARYDTADIHWLKLKGEDMVEVLPGVPYDEAWIYNCLQHVEDPAKVIDNAKRCAKLIRLFEWIDCGTSEGHPHELTEAKLNEWLGGEGKVGFVDENTAKGKAFWGIFPTPLFNK
jgi:hypothetical protein